MEYRESSERKSLFIKTLLIIILLLLAFLSSVLYVFMYPKTQYLNLPKLPNLQTQLIFQFLENWRMN